MGGRYDVVIVGAGIAGSALAAALAPAGLEILLLEAGALPEALPPVARTIAAVDPRVSALGIASVRLLQEVGAWQRLPDGVASPYESMRVWEEDGSGRIGFDAAGIAQPVLGHIVENRWVVATLLAALAAAPNVTVRGGERLLALEPVAGAVDARQRLGLGFRRLGRGGAGGRRRWRAFRGARTVRDRGAPARQRAAGDRRDHRDRGSAPAHGVAALPAERAPGAAAARHARRRARLLDRVERRRAGRASADATR
jgi:hypothetical protein